jgi:hypothetical protein
LPAAAKEKRAQARKKEEDSHPFMVHAFGWAANLFPSWPIQSLSGRGSGKPIMPRKSSLVRKFRDLSARDLSVVGGKNASLGEMIGALAQKGVRIPDGFATTAEAYRLFLEHNGLQPEISEAMRGLEEGGGEIAEN